MNIKWSWESIYDLVDISDYIEVMFGEKRADRFNGEIDTVIERMSIFPNSHEGVGLYYRGLLIRKFPFGPSIIFCAVEVDTIYILRVLRHEQNWQKMLREQIVYTFDW